MSKLKFYKYTGTGNDFILLDNRSKAIFLSKEQINKLCDRHFGIGADGLMLLEHSNDADFHMVYFNSDGGESTMCGNGGRCISAFAKQLGIVSKNVQFTAIDGLHECVLHDDETVSLHMIDVNKIVKYETYYELNTGSPHYVHYCDYVSDLDVKKEGALIRYSPKFKDQGINVNFVERQTSNKLFVRTYERGVEDETLSCGTGVTAAAISSVAEIFGKHQIDVQTLGGLLQVSFDNINGNLIKDIWLHGPARFVFEGSINFPTP